MSASSIVRAVFVDEAGDMHDLLIGAAILLGLLLLDVCAQYWGVDTRFDVETRFDREWRDRRPYWWF